MVEGIMRLGTPSGLSSRRGYCMAITGVTALALGALAGEFKTQLGPAMDKWMYPFEFGTGGSRPVAPTFASFDPRFDTRDAEFLLGWQTQTVIPTNAVPSRYVLKRVRLNLTVGRDLVNNATGERVTFLYDPSFDSYRTHLPDSDPAHQTDDDAGRPVEIFGVGFRNGFDAVGYTEDSSFGVVGAFTSNTISIGTRNSFAAVFNPKGELIDIANHVGQANAAWTQPPFEARPWAVGQTVGVNPGESVPLGNTFTFDLNLSDPQIAGYVARSLASGRLSLMVSSLSPAKQVTPGGTGLGGSGAYPQWSTREDNLFPGPVLELEGFVVGPTDSEADGLPDDWELWRFGNLAQVASGDPDADGASNLSEWTAGTDPLSSAEVFRITLTGPLTQPTLQFAIRPNRIYSVERSVDLTTWVPASGVLSYPSVGLATWTGSVEPVSEARFLRVSVRAE